MEGAQPLFWGEACGGMPPRTTYVRSPSTDPVSGFRAQGETWLDQRRSFVDELTTGAIRALWLADAKISVMVARRFNRPSWGWGSSTITRRSSYSYPHSFCSPFLSPAGRLATNRLETSSCDDDSDFSLSTSCDVLSTKLLSSINHPQTSPPPIRNPTTLLFTARNVR